MELVKLMRSNTRILILKLLTYVIQYAVNVILISVKYRV
jgi:hypothetical protein